MSKIIGHITDLTVTHGADGPGISATARITDASLWERMRAGELVGMSIGGKWTVAELTRWQRFRYWLGAKLIELGKRVRG